MNNILHDWRNIKTKELLAGLHARTVHMKNMTAIWWSIDKDAVLPEHSHPHEQIATCIDGEFELRVGGDTFHMKPHTTVCIPSNTKHSGRALSDCVVYDVFSPVREDYQR